VYFSDTSNLSMNSAKSRFFSILNHIEEVIIVSMFALMVIIIFVQVIMRKAGNSLSWSEELGKFLFVWISWMGISLGQREGEHRAECSFWYSHNTGTWG
jgi:TRAP-type C4-dicarboxylate transport system permease small subunit